MFGKKSTEKSAKNVFYIHTNVVTKKWGGKTRVTIFQKKRIVRSKNVGKKIVGKRCEKRFLYSHEYRDQKIGGIKRGNYFCRNTLLVRAKNVWKKIVG